MPVPAIRLSIAVIALLELLPAPPIYGAETNPSVPVEEFRLDNGMKFLLVPRPGITTVAAGWMVTAGSADDGDSSTGLSHLLEHLMFKGTQIIGSKDAAREQVILEQQDEYQQMLTQLRRDAKAASGKKLQKINRSISKHESRMSTLQQEARSLAFLGQFSFFYSELGATGLNANTYPDMTVYYVTLPANRLEGWFWMESDRLANPVFREFYKEIEVVHEERRLRIESTPTGSLDESIRSEFWGQHPYAWNPQGRSEDVDLLSRAAAESFFVQHYSAENLTAAFVGNFESSQVKSWARQYFGRLPRGKSAATTASSATPRPRGDNEKRIEATCNCTPQAQVHYPSVGFSHPDSVSLDVLAGVMNGRSGRLYRNLVLGSEIAFSAYTNQESWKQAGKFSFVGETKGSVTPADLVQAWDREVERLKTELVSDREIARTVNRLTADSFRSLKDPMALMSQLLYYEGLGGWNHVSLWPAEIRAVTAADIQRVAKVYLDPQTRTIALISRTKTTDRPLSKRPDAKHFASP